MSRQTIPYTTEGDWLAARTLDVTSTESSALFEASPYTTAFELYLLKSARLVPARTDNPRMRWGRRLQEPIALGVAEDQGLGVRPMREYVREPDERIGASFDYRIIDALEPRYLKRLEEHGQGLMEIKTVDPFYFRDSWSIVDGEVVEAPPHIELQVQHQLLVSGLKWALIVALVGGNRISVIERTYDPALGNAIMRKVREFWQLVDQGTPPEPDYTRDAVAIARLYVESQAGKVLDARQDRELHALVLDYQEMGEALRTHGKVRDELRARILERTGDASKVLLPEDLSLSCGTVRESLIPAHTRAAYRNLRVYHPKEPA